MKKFASAFLFSALAVSTPADEAKDFGEIFTKGKIDFKSNLVRYRSIDSNQHFGA